MIGLDFIMNLYNKKQQDLADELGIKRQNINSWLGGNRKIPKKYLSKLTEIFKGMDEEYFQKELDDVTKLKIQEIKLDYDKYEILNQNSTNRENAIMSNDALKIIISELKSIDAKINRMSTYMESIALSKENVLLKHDKMHQIHEDLKILTIERCGIKKIYKKILELNNK